MSKGITNKTKCSDKPFITSPMNKLSLNCKDVDLAGIRLAKKSFPGNDGLFSDLHNHEALSDELSHEPIIEKHKGNHGASILFPGDSDSWFLIGASVTGNAHVQNNVPCQDAHKIDLWDKGWGVAVISDGAGSSPKAHYASSLLVDEAVRYARIVALRNNWMESDEMPEEEKWNKVARSLMFHLREKLIRYAKLKMIPIHELHATLIIIIFSEHGLLITHVGDGRAGYMDKQGGLKAIMTPYEGEQVGETVFVTLDIQKNPGFIKSKVIREKIKAFFLLSDGCENLCWQTVSRDVRTGKYYKLNEPFAPFFAHTFKALELIGKKKDPGYLKQKWYDYLDKGHEVLRMESDDKTMVVGIANNKKP